MSRPCTVCLSEARPEIDQRLRGGEPFRNVAKQFALSAAAVYRHRRNHLTPRAGGALPAGVVTESIPDDGDGEWLPPGVDVDVPGVGKGRVYGLEYLPERVRARLLGSDRTQPVEDAAQRAQVLRLAAAVGFPRLVLSSGRNILPGASGWQAFTAEAEEKALIEALEALQAVS